MDIDDFVRVMNFFFFFGLEGCGSLFLQPVGIKPMPSALGARSLNHGTSREVPAL